MKKSLKALGIAALYLLFFLGVQTLASVIASGAIMWFLVQGSGSVPSMDAFTQELQANVTLVILVSNMLTIGIMWLIFLCRKKKFAKEICLVKTSRQNIIAAVFFGIGMAYTVDLITTLLPVSEQVMAEFMQEHSVLSQGNLAINFVSVAVLAPLAEEMIFRGLIFTRLKSAFRPVVAGLISAVLFGLVHGHPIWMLVGFIAGCALVWIFEVTGSLWCCIVVHIVNNTISNVSQFLPEMSTAVYLAIDVGAVILLAFCVRYIMHENPRSEKISFQSNQEI